MSKLKTILKKNLDRLVYYKKIQGLLVFIAYSGIIVFGFLMSGLTLYRDYLPQFPFTDELMAVLFCSQILLPYFFGLHRGPWKYSSINDIFVIAKVTFLSFLVNSTLMILLANISWFGSIRFTLLNHMFYLINFSALRVLVRLYLNIDESAENPQKIRVLILGAGDSGEAICRHITSEKKSFRIVGFLDDDPRKHKTKIHGYAVLGSLEKLSGLLKGGVADQVIIAMPSIPVQVLSNIVKICSDKGVPAKILPSLPKIFTEHAKFEIRNIDIRDLLEREVVDLDLAPIRDYYKGKKVLITGAAGSIGEEIVRQVAINAPEAVYLLDQAESPLYFLLRDCEVRFPEVKFVPLLGSVTDAGMLEKVFSKYEPEIVLHAAAYKHVPLLEDNIQQGLRVNVEGTKVMAEVSLRHGVERFIFISTDKAVNPTNVLGVTKNIAEKLCQSFQKKSDKTKFIIVRFGNVLGSQGSVVPLFTRQIEQGGPITLTHKDIQRYFMLIPEAVQLVLMASLLGNGGEVFVLDMGKKVKIYDLAVHMIRLAGYVPDRDIKIEFTGLRPGEKLYEELFDKTESIMKTLHPKINKAVDSAKRPDDFYGQIQSCLEFAESGASRAEVVEKLKKLVPNYLSEAESKL